MYVKCLFQLIVEVDILGTHLGKCVASCEGGSTTETTSRKFGNHNHQSINSIHVGKSCQHEQGHSFKLISVSSDRLGRQAGDVLGGTRPCHKRLC